MTPRHEPVLCQETVEWVAPFPGDAAPSPEGDYLDATFGQGGHSRCLLERLGASSRLLALDRDWQAFQCAEALAAEDARVIPRWGRFGDIENVLAKAGIREVRGAIMDLGLSSAQLDRPERGFSFQADGPLDMRMDQRQPLTAASWLNAAPAGELARIIRAYGEEPRARRIGQAIVAARPLSTTGELARIAAAALPNRGPGRRRHPATRVFQAVRMFVNRELDELQTALEGLFPRLAIGGRLAVISFHSLEDRIVKRFFRKRSSPPAVPREIPVRHGNQRAEARALAGPVRPGDAETKRNVRARSAVLRVLERIA